MQEAVERGEAMPAMPGMSGMPGMGADSMAMDHSGH
jgi:hypothetical protein